MVRYGLKVRMILTCPAFSCHPTLGNALPSDVASGLAISLSRRSFGYILFRAWSRSAMMSSVSSMPTEIRTSPSVIPNRSRLPGSTDA